MAVLFDAGAEPPVGEPRLLLTKNTSRTTVGRNRPYDPLPDGERFVMLASSSEETRDVRVVLDWVEQLKERVPIP